MIQVITVAAISRSSQILFPRTMVVTHWGSDNQHDGRKVRLR
jgi:hypothetical protein